MARRTSQRRQGATMDAIEADAARDKFLAEFARTGIVLWACEAAGVARNAVEYWQLHVPGFSDRYDVAREDANDVLRREAWRRGVTGWTVTTKRTTDGPDGIETQTTTVRQYDSALLRMVMQSRMPEFRDRVDVTSDGEALGNGDAIAAAAANPALAGLAAEFLQQFAGYHTPAISDDASRARSTHTD